MRKWFFCIFYLNSCIFILKGPCIPNLSPTFAIKGRMRKNKFACNFFFFDRNRIFKLSVNHYRDKLSFSLGCFITQKLCLMLFIEFLIHMILFFLARSYPATSGSLSLFFHMHLEIFFIHS